MCKSICRDTVAKDLIVADLVSSLGTGIAAVTLDGIDVPIFHFGDDTDMIG